MIGVCACSRRVPSASLIAQGPTVVAGSSGLQIISKNGEPTVTVGPLEGRIVPGLCAEGLETRSSNQSLEDGVGGSQGQKHPTVANNILYIISELRHPGGAYRGVCST